MSIEKLEVPVIGGIHFTAVNDKIVGKLEDQCGAVEVRQLLAWLPWRKELAFFDPHYPSASDPGAYVSVQRREALFVYMMGNHGWSSDWSKQSIELLAEWILLSQSHSSDGVTISTTTRGPWD
jgi:hypothetical protein